MTPSQRKGVQKIRLGWGPIHKWEAYTYNPIPSLPHPGRVTWPTASLGSGRVMVGRSPVTAALQRALDRGRAQLAGGLHGGECHV